MKKRSKKRTKRKNPLDKKTFELYKNNPIWQVFYFWKGKKHKLGNPMIYNEARKLWKKYKEEKWQVIIEPIIEL